MKKDERQTNSEQFDLENTSSTALTLQRFKKETEKKEAAAESAKVRCRICFKEVAPTPRCFGHGGGGGGGGSGSGTSSEEKARPTDDQSPLKKAQLVDDIDLLIGEFSSLQSSEGCDFDLQSDEELLDPEVIAELVAKGLVTINNDRESMTLTISLRCDPNSLSEEQRDALKKFMNAVMKEFNAFKERQSLSDDCIQIMQDEDENVRALRISLPTIALYDAFIQQLANNLVPTSHSLQKKEEYIEAKNFAPTPFSGELKPSNSSKKTEAEDEEREFFNPSPFAIKMKPWEFSG
jgi:hypothetical protein